MEEVKDKDKSIDDSALFMSVLTVDTLFCGYQEMINEFDKEIDFFGTIAGYDYDSNGGCYNTYKETHTHWTTADAWLVIPGPWT